MTYNETAAASPSKPTTGRDMRDSIMRAMDFHVEAILGETSLTLNELEALEAGQILTLSGTLNDLVSLRLNDVEIARGELVSVGDNFAVKITDVSD